MMIHISPIKIIISSQIKINMLFKINDARKRRMFDRKIHKAMRIPVEIHEINKKFTITVQPKNACKLEFVDHLWLPFIDQPHSDIVVFEVITFHIYNILVSKWKHGIGPIHIITCNYELEFLSTSIIELINIDESLHENSIVIFMTKK